MGRRFGKILSGIIDGVKQPPTGHAATIALFFGIVPENHRDQVLEYMKEHLIKEEAFPILTATFLMSFTGKIQQMLINWYLI